MVRILCILFLLTPTVILAQTTVGSDGTIYHRNGNTTITSNGEIIHHHGNTSISSSGTIYNTNGSITTGSDGSIIHNSGFGSRPSSSAHPTPSRRSSPSYNHHYRDSRSSSASSSRSNSYYRPQRQLRHLKNTNAEYDPSKKCYCLTQDSYCVMGRPNDTHVLEQTPGSCNAQVCEQSLRWSVKNLCGGKWRPFVNAVKDRRAEDDDGDGVKNVADLCPDSPSETPVWKHGKWNGCSEGQRPIYREY